MEREGQPSKLYCAAATLYLRTQVIMQDLALKVMLIGRKHSTRRTDQYLCDPAPTGEV